MIFMDGGKHAKKRINFKKYEFLLYSHTWEKNYVHGYNDHKALYENKIM